MADEAPKRRALARKRALATGLLVLAALVFVAMQLLPPNFFVRLAGTAAEAAVVGGLADWFAITALFRHPLGIPIPHTALIPTQKNEIGRALGNFVRDRFLDPQLVIRRLRVENRALQLAHWLSGDRAADFVAARILEIIPLLLRSSRDEHIKSFVSRLARDGLRRIDAVPLADAGLAALIESGKHMELADSFAALMEPSLGMFKEAIIRKVGEQTGRLFPKYFDRKIGKGIVRGLDAWLHAIRTPHSQERERLDRWIRARVAEFRGSPDYRRLIEDAGLAIASNPALHQALDAIWEEIKREIARDLQSDTPEIGAAIAGVIRMAGTLLAQTPEMQNHVNGALERLVVDYITPWRMQISDFIADVVQSWDARTVSELIELEVGSDLQFVRINGTVVGAMIGVLLFLLSAAISHLVVYAP